MANHRSSIKRARQTPKRTQRNTACKTRVKNVIKKARQALQQTNVSEITTTVRDAVRLIHKAASKNVLHKRTAARRVSRLMKQAAKQTAVATGPSA